MFNQDNIMSSSGIDGFIAQTLLTKTLNPESSSILKIRTLHTAHIVINIAVFKIDVDGSFKDSWGCTFHWKNADFKTTKFSFKLIERILIPVSKKIKTCSSIASGTSITSLIKDLEKKGINFDDVLNPLAGV